MCIPKFESRSFKVEVMNLRVEEMNFKVMGMNLITFVLNNRGFYDMMFILFLFWMVVSLRLKFIALNYMLFVIIIVI